MSAKSTPGRTARASRAAGPLAFLTDLVRGPAAAAAQLSVLRRCAGPHPHVDLAGLPGLFVSSVLFGEFAVLAGRADDVAVRPVVKEATTKCHVTPSSQARRLTQRAG